MKTKSLEKIAGYMICIPIFVKLLFALIFLENPGPIIILLIKQINRDTSHFLR